MFEYKAVVDTILNNIPYVNPKKLVPYRKKIDYDTYDVYEIPYDQYVWYLYQTIEWYNRDVTFDEKEGLVNIVFDMISYKSECNAHFSISDNNRYIRYGNLIFYYTDKGISGLKRLSESELKEVYSDLSTEYDTGDLQKDFKKGGIKTLIQFIQKKMEKCRFAAFPITLTIKDRGLHRNIIFAERVEDGKESKIVLNYYEPHGSAQQHIRSSVTTILENLEKYSEGEIIYNYAGVSCLQGAQTLSAPADIGYCIMFSLLWIYIVFSVVAYNINKGSYVPSIEWISKIEKYYTSQLGKKEIYGTVVSFAEKVFNRYIHKNYNTPEVRELFDQHFDEYINNNYFIGKMRIPVKRRQKYTSRDEYEIEQTSSSDSYSEEELKQLPREDPEITYESWQESKDEEDQNIKRNWYDYLKNKVLRKRTIGGECRKNSDCLSKRCKDNYCAAPLRSGLK